MPPESWPHGFENGMQSIDAQHRFRHAGGVNLPITSYPVACSNKPVFRNSPCDRFLFLAFGGYFSTPFGGERVSTAGKCKWVYS